MKNLIALKTLIALPILLFGTLYPSHDSRAQGEAAIPFLTLPSSPEGNGMGGIVGTTSTGNPLSVLSNPSQLGVMALDHYFWGGLYPSSTAWLPGLVSSNATYQASAFNAGLRLNRLISLPVEMSVGFGYSHVSLDYGLFAMTGPNGPDVTGYFDPEEHSNNWSIGIGAEYYVRLGLGYTTKSVVSSLAPFNVQGQGRQGVANISTYDLGAIAQIPVMKIIGEVSGSQVVLGAIGAEPVLDVTFGYARRNLGDAFVSYIDPEQADPLPRNAMLGVSYTAGFSLPFRSGSWEAISFTLAREAEDLLVQRFPAPTDSNGVETGPAPPPQYVDGNGAIQFFNNVILGEGNNHITLRRGWQIGFGEFFMLRGGSVRGRGTSYTTSGFGFRLGAVWKVLELISPVIVDSPVGGFLTSHIDAGFDHASTDYDDPTNPNNGVTYNGLSLVIR